MQGLREETSEDKSKQEKGVDFERKGFPFRTQNRHKLSTSADAIKLKDNINL